MTAARYLRRSLLHYRFAYLGVLAGSVLGATVLLGALFAGDSVARSLRRIGEQRIGRATHAVTAGDRFFREALATDLARATGSRVAPVLVARGTATHAANNLSAPQVQLAGVTDAFWQLAPAPTSVPLDASRTTIAVNEALARRLNVAVGDILVVRLHRPGTLGGNAPVAGAESKLQSIRGRVAAIVTDASFGRFSLEATQVAQPSVFLPIALMQEALDQPARANLLLAESSATVADLRRHLGATAQLGDYGLSLKWLDLAATFELTSSRIFLDPELAAALTAAAPAAQPVVSYLVNEFRARDRTTPYSIATATTPAAAPFLPADLGPRDIVLNDWLANDLKAAAGDDVALTFFQTDASGALAERSASFKVRAIVPLQGLAADKAWMPDFPGISNVAHQSDWDPGLPLKLDRIRPHDERYWDDHRGAPKAFLSPAAAREIWSNRWGDLTALRLAAPRDTEVALTATLLRALRPELNQIAVRDLRVDAQTAAKSAVDFGGLFIGMSFFLIVAALGLVAMLFQFVLLQRNREDALLGAVGLPGRTLRRWRLAEAAAILLVGCALGLPVAALYTRGILRLLESIWAGPGAVATFAFAAEPASIAGGSVGFIVISLLAIWWVLRREARRTISIRLAAQAEETTAPENVRRSSQRIAAVAALIAVAAIALSGRGMPPQGAFFLAGFALLVAGLALCRAWMCGTGRPTRDGPNTGQETRATLDPARLGALNLKARRSRSLTVIGAIASAVFMVLSVASFRKQVGADWLQRGSGTGGFAFWVETTAPLNLARDGRTAGFEAFEGAAAQLGEIVPLRAGTGDNVNCYNLNTTAQPQLVALDTAKLAARGAFHLTGPAAGWNALRTVTAAGALPAFADETTLMWALKRKVGDVLDYTDENSRTFPVQIAGVLPDSLFQGVLVVDEKLFLEKFPSHAGYTRFLLDAKPGADLAAVRARLETATRDAGGRVQLTREVLAAFHQIENTYIAIFNVLGSLGVVLGSLGLAIVVARNLRERRGEFAVMAAIGLSRPVLARMVAAEFGRLVLWGVGVGAMAAAVAIVPAAGGLPALPAVALVVTLLLGIVGLNLASGWAIFRWSVRDLRPSVVQGAE
ncbi:MAG: ABC transporter permease [Verrucomicrobia bacterium]|nr:ABC transporter permease [Verrucomicrobiota bacterium]